MGQKTRPWYRFARRATAAAFTAAALLLAGPVPSAQAEGAWTLTYDLDPADGMNCSMATYWGDGSEFSIFANANDFVGFYISDPAWRLSQGQQSYVSFRFGGREFSFPVTANDASSVIGDLSVNEYGAIKFLERVARAYQMTIVFPQGTTWGVDLTGTMATFRQWIRCHDQLERLARGGGGGFGGGSNVRPSGNPF